MKGIVSVCFAALASCAAHAPTSVRTGQVLATDYSYDGEYISAFVAVEGVQVDAQVDPPGVAEVRRVRECKTGQHIPHVVGVGASSPTPSVSGHEFLTLPAGIFWGRYLRTSLAAVPGPDCIIATLGFPTYSLRTGEIVFMEADVELRRR